MREKGCMIYPKPIFKDLFKLKKKILFTPFNDSPSPSSEWINLSNEKRINIINKLIEKTIYVNFFQVIITEPDGQVIVRLIKKMSASERGTILLDFEEFLKSKIDLAINVWAESLGDKNSLRNLRGIEIKHDR